MSTCKYSTWFSMVLLVVLSPALFGQSLWVSQHTDKAVALELMKPNFDGDGGISASSGVGFVSLRLPVAPTVVFVGELPFAHAGSEIGDVSDNAVGNPYLGVEFHPPGSSVFWDLGVRAPVAPENNSALFIGVLTDQQRWEAFLPNVATVKGAFNFRHRAPTGLVTRLRAGPNIWIPTEEGPEVEVVGSYSWQVGYEAAQVSVLGGLTGQAIITEGDMDLGERTTHQAGAIVTFVAGNVRPGVFFQLPLDEDLRDTVDYVFGLNVSIELP